MCSGDELVRRLDLGVTWDDGSPRPVLLATDTATFLIFHLPERVDWSTPVDDLSQLVEEIAVIEFGGCSAVLFGGPGEETLHGHRLWSKGLRSGEAFEVINSAWVAERARVDSVHRSHDASRWARKRHLVLCLHDRTFECITDSYTVTTTTEPIHEVLINL